jgi:hypothetical protein
MNKKYFFPPLNSYLDTPNGKGFCNGAFETIDGFLISVRHPAPVANPISGKPWSKNPVTSLWLYLPSEVSISTEPVRAKANY